MAGELYRVILHFRSNFQEKPDRRVVEDYITKFLETMQGLGHVENVEVLVLDEIPTMRDELDRSTIPVPAPVSVPAVIISEPETGKRTKIPGTGDPET
jgi:hypothetical protein